MSNPRLIIIGAVATAVLAAAGIGLLLGRSQASRANLTPATFDQPSTAIPTHATGSAVGVSTPPPNADPPSASPTDRARSDEPDGSDAKLRLVIKSFGKEFTHTDGGRRDWLRRLSPYATQQVQQDLATVDPDNIPVGHVAEYEILKPGDTEVAARVTYREGWSTVVYLITDGSNWRVFRYDRFDE